MILILGIIYVRLATMDIVRIFIIGAGKDCQILLEYLLPFSWIHVVGVADCNPSAPAIEMAQRAGLPIYTANPIEMLKAQEVDIVFELTGDEKVRANLLGMEGRRFGVATGDAVHLFVNTILEAKEKDRLLKKHMEISLMIAQSKTVAQIFDTIVTGGMEMTDMPVGSLALFDQDKEEFAIVSQKGLPKGLLQRERYSIRPGGFTQFVLSSSKPTVIDDLKENTVFDSTFLLNAGIRSLVAIPLVSEWELLGILYYDDINARTYPPYLVDQLGQFATAAVIAIQKHKALAQVKQLSSRDPLTGLYNRGQLGMQLKEVLLRADREKESVALLVCDLDQFKEVNEKFGHQYGDHVLKIMVDSVSAAVVKEDTGERPSLFFRSGVDEITVLLHNVNHERILHTAFRIRKAVQDASETAAFPLDVSIGVALYPTESQTQDQMMTLANQSLIVAKKSDQKICIGSAGAFNHSDRIHILLEPIVDLGQNLIIGYEALSRDAHGKFGIADIFKQYAALGELSEVKNNCFVTQIEMAEALNLERVFLNVDSALLNQCGWVQKPPNIDVVLEISESESLEDYEDYLKIAKKWREKGFKFAIDDFGAGFISLPFISRLSPDYIKVDRSVILQAVTSPQFRTFLKSIVGALQKDQAISIIAEGIEMQEELEVAWEVGIPLIQGFLLKEKGYPNRLASESNVHSVSSIQKTLPV